MYREFMWLFWRSIFEFAQLAVSEARTVRRWTGPADVAYLAQPSRAHDRE